MSTHMFRIFVFPVIFVFLSVIICAQGEKNTAPTKWERYKVSDKEVSLLLPKMPVMIKSGDLCHQRETNTYSVYSEEVAYTLTITAKFKDKRTNGCGELKAFDRSQFEDRLDEIRKTGKNVQESSLVRDGRSVKTFATDNRKYWVFDDLNKNRWYELAITRRPDTKFDESRFVESLTIGRGPSGIEIGNGSQVTLGDESPQSPNSASPEELKPSAAASYALHIVMKPRASYTEVARKNNTQGTVQLRVAFLADGSIGTVSPITTLPFGLTEQAIIAVRKMVFIPKKVNDTLVPTVKTVEYSFSIY
jgi:hypothetical protein